MPAWTYAHPPLVEEVVHVAAAEGGEIVWLISDSAAPIAWLSRR
ncbi:hypothetical protein ACLK19_23660 [Escherichia coli]